MLDPSEGSSYPSRDSGRNRTNEIFWTSGVSKFCTASQSGRGTSGFGQLLEGHIRPTHSGASDQLGVSINCLAERFPNHNLAVMCDTHMVEFFLPDLFAGAHKFDLDPGLIEFGISVWCVSCVEP